MRGLREARVPLVGVAALAAWAALPARGAAQLDEVGSPVAEVRVESDGRPVTDPQLDELIETRVGQPLAMIRVRETIEHLVLLGRYDDIVVEARDGERGVELVYRLSPARLIADIDFHGRVELSEDDLRRLLRDRFGTRPRGARMADMVRALAEHYRAQGYFQPELKAALERTGQPSETTLVIEVDAGPRARIGEIRVEGDPPGGVARVRSELRLAEGRPWDAVAANRRVEQYAASLRERGHYEALVDLAPAPRQDGAVVDLALTVEPGPIVDLVFEGDPLPQDRVDALVPVRREGSADEDLLEDSKRRIEDFLHAEGYARAAVDYRRTDEDGRLRIAFDVRRGRRFVVSDVNLTGVQALPAAEIDALLRTRAGAPFVEGVLGADTAAIAGHYRERGFADVRVSRTLQTNVPAAGEGPDAVVTVIPHISVVEGPVTRVGSVTIRGNDAIGDATLRAGLSLVAGGPFYQPRVASDRTAILRAYANRGYRDASVEATTTPAGDARTVDVLFTVTEGEQAIVDHLIVLGNRRTGLDTIVRELRLAPGDPVGAGALAEAQQRLSALGLFRRVRVEDRAVAGDAARDIVVTVEEAPATTVGYGAGLEAGEKLRRQDDGSAVEELDFAPRAFFEIGRRNLWGKNRSVSLFARASFRRSNADTAANESGQFGFNEYRVVGSYREPRLFDWAADAQVTAFVEQAIRTSFSYRRSGVNADLTRRMTPTLTVIGRYTFGSTSLFDEQYNPSDQPLIDRLFPQVALSIFSGGFAHDTRDDVLDPTRGTFTSLDTALAARVLGGRVGFVKGFGEAFVYRSVSRAARVVFAGGLRLGLATGFKRLAEVDGEEVEIKDLPASERFYAGGGTTVRGFAQDRLGGPGTIDADGFPTGGNAVLITSGELRFPLWRSVGGVAFVDAGNVYLKVSEFDLSEIRTTAGFGIRYRSPVGPIRVDVGFKLDRDLGATGARESLYQLHIGLGQAF